MTTTEEDTKTAAAATAKSTMAAAEKIQQRNDDDDDGRQQEEQPRRRQRPPPPHLIMKEVMRVSSNKLTVAEFEKSKSYRNIPIVFEQHDNDDNDEDQNNNNDDWMTIIQNKCGHIKLPLPDDDHSIMIVNQSLIGKEWSGLQRANLNKHNIRTMHDFLMIKKKQKQKKQDEDDELKEQLLYLHSAPLSYYCPPLLDVIQIPKYFSRDYTSLIYKEFSPEMIYQHKFPSLFIGLQKGTGSPLHVDWGMTNFWSLQLSGNKLWRLVSPSQYNNLYPNYNEMTNEYTPSIFSASVMDSKVNFTRYPKLNGTIVYETILKPNEIMYVPGGWAHEVLNLHDNTIMVAMNFVDNYNLKEYINYVQYNQKHNEPFQVLKSFFIPLDNPYYNSKNKQQQQEKEQKENNINVYTFFKNQSLLYTRVPKKVKQFVSNLQQRKNGGSTSINSWRSVYGFPALHEAAAFNFISVIKYLIKKAGEADKNTNNYVNVRDDKFGATALDVAIKLKHKEAEILLKKLGGKTMNELNYKQQEEEKEAKKQQQQLEQEPINHNKKKEEVFIESVWSLPILLVIVAFLTFIGCKAVGRIIQARSNGDGNQKKQQKTIQVAGTTSKTKDKVN